jgi:hypothetical protein
MIHRFSAANWGKSWEQTHQSSIAFCVVFSPWGGFHGRHPSMNLIRAKRLPMPDNLAAGVPTLLQFLSDGQRVDPPRDGSPGVYRSLRSGRPAEMGNCPDQERPPAARRYLAGPEFSAREYGEISSKPAWLILCRRSPVRWLAASSDHRRPGLDRLRGAFGKDLAHAQQL